MICSLDTSSEARKKIDTDPDLPVEDCLTEDYLAFAKWGLERDAEIRKTQPDAVVGPASWLPIFRETEQLIRGELWPAVQAVGEKLVGALSICAMKMLAHSHPGHSTAPSHELAGTTPFTNRSVA